MGFKNVEFRLGEIEHLPVADNTVDVIISNCVVNLSPDKPQVFNEAFRVLRSGGQARPQRHRYRRSPASGSQGQPERLGRLRGGSIGCEGLHR